MTEQQGAGGDHILHDAQDMAEKARDLGEARTEEISLVEEQRLLDEQMAELRRKGDELAARRAALHDREVVDERAIEADLRDADKDIDGLTDHGGGLAGPGGGGSGGGGPVSPASPASPPAPTTYRFFVDGQPYDTQLPRLSGAQIKAKVPHWDPTHDLLQEGVGGAADRIVTDGEEVDFSCQVGPVHFSSAPKANFG